MNTQLNQYKPERNTIKKTFCVFVECDVNLVENLVEDYVSPSGSKYFYNNKGMYRLSNHWGRLANSKWRLIASIPESVNKRKLGFASWNDFYPDNDFENLYYIEVDFDKKVVTYQHKNNPNYNPELILRTSKETTKRIKQIRNLLELTNWAKYFEQHNIDELRKIIIDKLINTNKSLDEIKRTI
jgi:hypothetical protein